MTTPMLFGRPYGEMRGEFTRRRMESDAYFGVHDVGQQLKRELLSSVPTINFPWERVLVRDIIDWTMIGRDALDLIAQLCTPVQPSDELGHFLPLCGALNPERAGLYVGRNFALVLTYDVAGATGYQFGVSDGLVRKELHVVLPEQPIKFHRSLLADLLLTEWREGRKNWQEARALLYRLANNNLVREADKTRDEFNWAVAVSRDLTRLVHADHVIVFFPNGGQPPRLYPAEVFRTPGNTIARVVHSFEKIEHSGVVVICFKDHWCDSVSTIESLCDTVRRRGPMHLVPYGSTGQQKLWQCRDGLVFMTPVDHCPGLLPEGYRVLKRQ